MTVLFLTTHFNTGGITSYILSLVEQLLKKGVRIIVASSGGNMVPSLEAMGAHHEMVAIDTKSMLSPKVMTSARHVARMCKEYDVDIIHSHTRVTQACGYFAGIFSGHRSVTTCHGFFKPKWIRKVLPCWGDAVIAISPQVAHHLIEDLHAKQKNVYVVHNGIDVGRFAVAAKADRPQRRKIFGYDQESLIGMIARLSDVKGHDTIIQAMPKILERVENARFVIVGEGKEGIHLKELAESVGVADKVDFFSVVDRTTEFLSIFDCFVLPSRQEGLGLSLMEAQAAGLPVVASRVGGIPTLVEDQKTGLLVEPDDINGFAHSISRVLLDRDFAKSLGEAAQQKAREYYGSDKMADEILEVYKKVLREKA